MFPQNIEPFHSFRAIVASYAIVLEADGKDGHSPAIAASSSPVRLVVASMIFFALVFCLVHPKIDSSFASTCSPCSTILFPPYHLLAFLSSASALRWIKRISPSPQLPLSIIVASISFVVATFAPPQASCPRLLLTAKSHSPLRRERALERFDTVEDASGL